jgi:hypothetical protein
LASPEELEALRREWEARQQQADALANRRYVVGAAGDPAAAYNYAGLLDAASQDAEAALLRYREAMKASWPQR